MSTLSLKHALRGFPFNQTRQRPLLKYHFLEHVWIPLLNTLLKVFPSSSTKIPEKALLLTDSEKARRSLHNAYLKNGECETSAELLTRKAFLKSPVKAMVEEKYGIEYEEFVNPWHAAVSSFFAFTIGSIFPVIAILLFPVTIRIPATVIVVGLALLMTGYVSARLGGAPTRPAMRRNLIVGLLTMLVTYLVGQLFSV